MTKKYNKEMAPCCSMIKLLVTEL